jgi:hypothetical protein
MSLTALASKLYTIKSRKNVPLSSAFGMMLREDLAMRLSVYNLVKITTRSEFLATVAQAKYGKKTPLEREEEAQEKKRRMADQKFKQFTVGSIANLNNKINTLTAITERNTALIANLYSELGAGRNKKMPSLSALNAIKDPTAVRLPLRNKTIKGQLDLIRDQLQSLSANKKPFLKKPTPSKQKKEKDREEKDLTGKLIAALLSGGALKTLASAVVPLLAAGAVNAGLKAGSRELQRSLGVPEDKIEGSNKLNQVTDPYVATAGAGAAGYLAYKLKKAYDYFKRPAVKVPGPTAAPAATSIPTKPSVPSTPRAPSSAVRVPNTGIQFDQRLNNGRGGYRDLATGRVVKAPAQPIGSLRGPGTTSSAVTGQNMPSSRIPGLIRRLPPGISKFLFGAGRVLGTGPQTIALLMQGAGEMASGRAGEAELAKQQAKVAKFGIKFIRGEDGTPIYEINGKQYTSENLPPEYQVILNAYVGDQRAASATEARKKIAENPKLYNSLIVQGPPSAGAAETNVAASVIAAAKAAELTIPEPTMIGAGTVAAQTPVAAGQKIDLGTIPSVSYIPGQPVGVETIKQIIVNAANIVGVDPAIMLAMGKQESNFNPNAIPINKKTGKVTSSAKGLFQFLKGTWKEMVEKYAKDYPQLNNGPFDPLANALAGALYVKENSAFLKRRKIPITGTSIYATHFLGPGGAAKLFGAPISAPATAVFKEEAKSNPWVFMNKDGSSKTIQEVIDFLYTKVGRNAEMYTAELKRAQPPPMLASAPNVAVASPPPVAAATQAETPAVEAQVTSIAALTAANMMQEKLNAVTSEIIKDRKFNVIDDPVLVNMDMQNYGLA